MKTSEKVGYRNIKNNIGMFDFFKGLGMISIILGHTLGLIGYNFYSGSSLVTKLLFMLALSIGEAIIPAFFIISGYGFRKKSIKKCITQQSKLILKTYMIVAIVTVIFFFLMHYFTFKYLPASLKESIKIIGGFLFVLHINMDIFGISFYNCGPMWYLIALFIGWIILDIIMVKIPEKSWNLCILLVVIIGCIMGGFNGKLPFCLAEGLTASGYLYIGYKIKKNKAFLKKQTRKQWCTLVGVIIIYAVVNLISNMSNDIIVIPIMIEFVKVMIDAFIAYCLLYYILCFNLWDSTLVNGVRTIGRYSFDVFYIHTMEMLVVPWYLISMEVNPIVKCIIIFIMRSGIIFTVCFMINNRKRILDNIKTFF